jgi:hypothetical protein
MGERSMSNNEWKEIASADDDSISSELLDWSGLYDTWSNLQLDYDFDFTRDVADYCDNIIINKEEWDSDMPGMSGVWHTVETCNEDSLRGEMRSLLAKLIWENRQLIRKRIIEMKESIAN